jgi:hypothetical protein
MTLYSIDVKTLLRYTLFIDQGETPYTKGGGSTMTTTELTTTVRNLKDLMNMRTELDAEIEAANARRGVDGKLESKPVAPQIEVRLVLEPAKAVDKKTKPHQARSARLTRTSITSSPRRRKRGAFR